MTAVGAAGERGETIGVLDKRHIIAREGFNRWLVPPAALAIHLCIGMAYGFSVFWLPLSRAIGIDRSVECAGMRIGQALFTTTCDWRIADLGWMYTLFFVLLGISAATWGGWLERAGPRKAGVVSAFCWCGGLLISALGVIYHQLWMLWLGSGVIGGIGLGLGYISPVSTLIKWFPDRRGMATGMAIMGFGGGAMIGAPLANLLMNQFRTENSVGVWQTFVAMAAIYFVFMLAGAFGYRLPPTGWKPEGWTPRASKPLVATRHVHLQPRAQGAAVLADLGRAVPERERRHRRHRHRVADAAGDLRRQPDRPARRAVHRARSDAGGDAVATIAAGFTGLLSLFNIGGRFFWASLSDIIGRKATYYTFFLLGIVLYASAPWLAHAGIRSRCSCSRSASSSRCMAAVSRRSPRISPTSSARISSARSMGGC